MSVIDIAEELKKEPTVMNDDKEYDYLKAVAKLHVDDILKNKKIFIDVLDRIIYSYRENFLEESAEIEVFFDWASSLEGVVDNADIRAQLIYAIEEFSDSEELAESRIKTPEGRRILHS